MKLPRNLSGEALTRSLGEVADLAATLSVPQRMAIALRRGAMSAPDLDVTQESSAPRASSEPFVPITLDVNNASRYYRTVIRGFRDRETEKLFRREHNRAVPASLRKAALRKLLLLDAADSLEDLRVPPGNRLEKLRGDRAGQHSVRINQQYRICFTWSEGSATDVEIVDYH